MGSEKEDRSSSYWCDIEQVDHDVCVAVFSYLDGNAVRAKMETCRGIDNYAEAHKWLTTMKREYLEPCEPGPLPSNPSVLEDGFTSF